MYRHPLTPLWNLAKLLILGGLIALFFWAFVVLFLSLGELAYGAGTKGPDFGSDPPRPPRFTPAQTEAILEHARKAAPLYPQVGGIGYVTGKGVLVLESFAPLLRTPLGACDSFSECHKAADEACRNAGHEGGDEATTEINDDRTLCSEDCSDGSGAVALVSCNGG